MSFICLTTSEKIELAFLWIFTGFASGLAWRIFLIKEPMSLLAWLMCAFLGFYGASFTVIILFIACAALPLLKFLGGIHF